MQRIVYRREPNGEPVCCMPSLASIRVDSSFDADNAKICSRHFTDDCFKHGPSGTRRTLIPGSLPTLWMPSKSVETPETTRQEPSYREPPPEFDHVAYFNFEDIRKDLGKVRLPWCITETLQKLLNLQLFWTVLSSRKLFLKVTLVWQLQPMCLGYLLHTFPLTLNT
ncbi:hypothetical protein LSAT2_030629 [Lamellibrachia satsuma]|nr:hypothetical protein LSAT2_030629 [Lamellibrachia satsuma]